MRDELLPYYERELTFIRQMAAEFAEKYPKIAGRLLLEPDKCEDPHVERLIESFALLAGGSITNSTTSSPKLPRRCWTCFIRTSCGRFPRMAIAQFQLDPSQSARRARREVPAGHGAPQQAGERPCLLVPHLLSGHSCGRCESPALPCRRSNRFVTPGCQPMPPP